MSRTLLSRLSRAVSFALLLALSALFLIPFYLLVRNGLATDPEITAPNWTFVPHTLHASNITELFDDPTVPMTQALWNSTLIAVLTTAGTLLLASLAGYGLARIPYPHAPRVFYGIVATLMIPPAVTFVPSFVLVSSLGWISTLQGLIVPTLFSAIALMLFRQYFLGFPGELEDAAALDGLGYWRTYWYVVVPNSKPIFAAVGALIFIGSWNSFLWPLVIGQDESSWTVQVVLSTFSTSETVDLHELFIAAAVSIVPLLAVFVALQRHLVAGVNSAGMADWD
jgi:multiple sugar transport system permease protein